MMRTNDLVVGVAGIHKLPTEPFNMPGSTEVLNCVAPAQAQAAEEEDEMDDLFGEEDDDEAAAAEARDHAAMLRGKAFEAKKKAAAEAAGKAPLEAKSLIIWEVKPVDDETDLQALGKRIIAISMDGLFWKTEFKTAPIAYGIEKLIIGATIIDAKVSTDDVQELIEEMEDMVQSVDIQSFNKL
jgi:elongation factor 1-beta